MDEKPPELRDHQLSSDAAHLLKGFYARHRDRMLMTNDEKMQSVGEVFALEDQRVAEEERMA